MFTTSTAALASLVGQENMTGPSSGCWLVSKAISLKYGGQERKNLVQRREGSLQVSQMAVQAKGNCLILILILILICGPGLALLGFLEENLSRSLSACLNSVDDFRGSSSKLSLIKYLLLNGTERRISESYLPSLATSCENMASNSGRIKEKTRKFQIVYVGRTNLCIHCTTDHYETGDSLATTLSHCRAVASA